MEQPNNWSKLQKETSEEFVDKLLLHVRTNNYEDFVLLLIVVCGTTAKKN